MFQGYFSVLFVWRVTVFSRPIFVAALKQSVVSLAFFSTKDIIFNVPTSHDVSRLSICWFWSRNFLYTAVIKSCSKRCFITLSLPFEMPFPIFLHWLSAVTDTVQHSGGSNCSQATNSRNTGLHLVECCCTNLLGRVSLDAFLKLRPVTALTFWRLVSTIVVVPHR